MNPIIRIVKSFSSRSRAKRAQIFKKNFLLTGNTKILDLGSENGQNINNVLAQTDVKDRNVYIADISLEPLEQGYKMFGYVPVHLPESGKLPFPDGFFDIVYCSSVIEHVTISKNQVWEITSEQYFQEKSLLRQKKMAEEIDRVGKSYFVQTPYRYFPIESHTWLPFLGFLPRKILIPALKMTNRFWIKKTGPDWHLLTRRQMKDLFPGANILEEKVWGLTKSIIAVKQDRDVD